MQTPPTQSSLCSHTHLQHMLPPTGPQVYEYFSPVTNATYLLNTNVSNASVAHTYCTTNGGHLVAWGSLEEQADVEQYYINAGFLLPTFHKQYHIGLRVDTRPSFKWTEPYYSLQEEGAYLHWGMDGRSPEPNNQQPPEDCGAATARQAYDSAWGWSDVNCTRRLIFMCKILRE
jgi:hypothetical protein